MKRCVKSRLAELDSAPPTARKHKHGEKDRHEIGKRQAKAHFLMVAQATTLDCSSSLAFHFMSRSSVPLWTKVSLYNLAFLAFHGEFRKQGDVVTWEVEVREPWDPTKILLVHLT